MAVKGGHEVATIITIGKEDARGRRENGEEEVGGIVRTWS